MADCPQAVQATITQNLQGGEVQRIETKRYGRYEVLVTTDKAAFELKIAADGMLLGMESEGRNVRLADCPEAVQATIRQNLHGGRVLKIEPKFFGGFEATVMTNSGTYELEIASDGMLREIEGKGEYKERRKEKNHRWHGDKHHDDDEDDYCSSCRHRGRYKRD